MADTYLEVRHYLISGQVQGVGFRAFTTREALALGLSGWVRNLRDGRVEALAQGPSAAFPRFEAKLREGPRHGRVDSLSVKKIAGPLELRHFHQRDDGDAPYA